jgi:predicted dehydrogenase
MLDLMRIFCGEFIEVKSYISNDYWSHDVEDNAFALMRDKHNRVAMLHSSATQWHHKFSLEVGLTEGILELQGILSGSKSYGEEKLVITKKSNLNNGSLENRTMRFLEDNSWKDEIDEFAEAIICDKPIKYGTSNDALKTMQLVYTIYSADQEWAIKL